MITKKSHYGFHVSLVFLIAFTISGCASTSGPPKKTSSIPNRLYSEGTILTPDGLGVLFSPVGKGSDGGALASFSWLDVARKGNNIFWKDHNLCKKSSNAGSSNASNQDINEYIRCMEEKGYQPISCSDREKYARQELESGAAIPNPNFPPGLYIKAIMLKCKDVEYFTGKK